MVPAISYFTFWWMMMWLFSLYVLNDDLYWVAGCDVQQYASSPSSSSTTQKQITMRNLEEEEKNCGLGCGYEKELLAFSINANPSFCSISVSWLADVSRSSCHTLRLLSYISNAFILAYRKTVAVLQPVSKQRKTTVLEPQPKIQIVIHLKMLPRFTPRGP